jgi:hypothetical protein
MERFSSAQKKDIKVLVNFVQVFCTNRHRDQAGCELPADLADLFKRGLDLCPDCRALVEYALAKRSACPLDPKPSCKKCHIHCYSPAYRARIREIMAFSGRRMVLRGRLDYFWHYFF